ncbi:MAG: hypothetical protein ABR613_01720 [Actinomycetota bacterium]
MLTTDPLLVQQFGGDHLDVGEVFWSDARGVSGQNDEISRFTNLDASHGFLRPLREGRVDR